MEADSTQHNFEERLNKQLIASAKRTYDDWKEITSRPFDESLVSITEDE